MPALELPLPSRQLHIQPEICKGDSVKKMSGSSSDRSQQSALGRLHVLQQTAEFIRHTFPSLWQEPEFPRMTSDRREDVLPPIERPELPQQPVQYYSQPIPIPGAHLRNGGRVRQEVPFLTRAHGNRRNGHRGAYNGNEEISFKDGYHAEEHREAHLPPLNGSGAGHRRRSE